MSLYILEIKSVSIVEGSLAEVMKIKKKLEKEFDSQIELIEIVKGGLKK